MLYCVGFVVFILKEICMYMKDTFAWFIYMPFSLSFKSIIKGALMQILKISLYVQVYIKTMP